jgi:imidazole glycerol phosphate synthase subunit HisF
MLKKIFLGSALVGGFAAVATVSLLLNVGAYEPSIERSAIDTIELMTQAKDLPQQPAADAI